MSAKISTLKRGSFLAVAAAAAALWTSSGTAGVAAASESEGECRRAFNRALAARHRAERSVSRSRVALLRVHSELRRAGLPAAAPVVEPPSAASAVPAFDAANPDALSGLVHGIWERKKDAQRIAARAIEEMDRRRLRTYPVSFRGPEIDPNAENVMPEGLGSCTAWAVHGEQGAFRAEQAAQLADDEAMTEVDAVLLAEIAEIRRTLLRIERGDYGACLGCGEAIGDARLAALPTAPLCVRCAADQPAR